MKKPKKPSISVQSDEKNSIAANDSPPVNPSLAKFQLFLPITFLTILPLIITRRLWALLVDGFLPRAVDGSGHYVFAHIYSKTIFPATSGWIPTFFAGMPFPNFYPPLFYWLIGILSSTGVTSFSASFKFVLAAPLIILPVAIWTTAQRVSDGQTSLSAAAAFGCCLLLSDYHFTNVLPLGLDYFSTFLVGLYTQPLGFVLLLIWLSIHFKLRRFDSLYFASALLLALVILANFFAATTACFFSFAFFLFDLMKILQRGRVASKERIWQPFIIRTSIPFVSLSLSAFWIVPMCLQSEYFVTRPSIQPLLDLIPPAMWLWYAAAAIGFGVWLKRPSEHKNIYFLACGLLFVCLFILAPILPGWFPIQSNRFLAIFNFLLCLPVGEVIAILTALLARAVGKYFSGFSIYSIKLTLLLVIVTLSAFFLKSPILDLAFYPHEQDERITPVLNFARSHREGRYLVEVPSQKYPAAQLDARALNSYLGMQGNDVASVVFREASPNSLFFNPLVNSFSAHPDSYGISSILADDVDFIEQPVEKHLEQAKFLGVRYLTIISPWIKEKISREPEISNRYDFGAWSIFELNRAATEQARVLEYQPALVISSFSFKARLSNDISFVRLAEEQFSDAWLDVQLVRSPQIKIDELGDLSNFGALIVEEYDFNDEELAFNLLTEYAERKPLILFRDQNSLFTRIEAAHRNFRQLTIIERPVEEAVHQLNSEQPTTRYSSSRIREIWRTIREILDQYKLAVDPRPNVLYQTDSAQISLKIDSGAANVPVLLNSGFHPNWTRTDEEPVYLTTPAFSLTFVTNTAFLQYSKSDSEKVSIFISLLVLTVLTAYQMIIWKNHRKG